jgi:cytochrome bd-type quinol oxidase subunit 2
MTVQLARERSARAAALWMLLFGFVAAVLTGLSAASWLQGFLRFGCSWSVGGTESPSPVDGGWVCGDGIVLLLPGAAILVLGGLAVLMAALLFLAVWRRVRERAAALASAALLAVVPTVVTCLMMLREASVHDGNAQEAIAAGAGSRLALWNEFALPALIATVAAACLAAVGLWLRARSRSRRFAGALVIAALMLLLVSAALSILGTLSLGLVAAGIIAGASSLSATVGHEPGERPGATPQEKFCADVDRGRSRSTS